MLTYEERRALAPPAVVAHGEARERARREAAERRLVEQIPDTNDNPPDDSDPHTAEDPNQEEHRRNQKGNHSDARDNLKRHDDKDDEDGDPPDYGYALEESNRIHRRKSISPRTS